MKRYMSLLASAIVVAIVPGVARGALSLQIGSANGTTPDTVLFPNQGLQFFDLIFHETGGVNPEGLFTYDIGVDLTRAPGANSGINLVTYPLGTLPAVQNADFLGPNNVFNTGVPPSVTILESTPTRLLFNVTSGGDLNDIDEGETAARIAFTAAPDSPFGSYTVALDPNTTVFGSGNPDLPLEIIVDKSDTGGIFYVPEPSGAALVGTCGLLALRRRRRAQPTA